ncbi:hypothetical protein NLL48_11450 [Corynebacterium tuberculostearicum]|nr:hypothetical protein NLL48_11450 [Corynebacterium tuberculostearicum]
MSNLTRNDRNPLVAFLLALITFAITIALYVKNGFGIDSIAFGVATIILLFAAFGRMNKKDR